MMKLCTGKALTFLLLLMLSLGCVNNPQLKQALQNAAKQAQQELKKSKPQQEKGHSPSKGTFKRHKQDSDSELLDSLFTLMAQDVGINPDEGSVQKAIWRVRVMKLNLGTARQSLDNTREEIFNLAATTEEKKALKEMQESSNEDSLLDDDLLLDRRRRFQDEALEKAKDEGRLERRKLTGEQAGRVGLMLYNLGVGVLCDHLAIQHGERVVSDFKRVKRDLFDEGGWNGAMAWISLAAYHEEFLAVPADMKEILSEAPGQIKALQAMISTVSVLKQNNPIESPEVKAGDSFESLEDF